MSYCLFQGLWGSGLAPAPMLDRLPSIPGPFRNFHIQGPRGGLRIGEKYTLLEAAKKKRGGCSTGCWHGPLGGCDVRKRGASPEFHLGQTGFSFTHDRKLSQTS